MSGKPKPRILFYFLHLLGVGHVFRAKRLIEGFARHGIAVDVIYGGEPINGINFMADSVHYLPPIRAGDSAYSFYLDADGNRLDKPFQDKRRAELLSIFSALDPDAILIEAFPFGRRMVRDELLALLQAARARPRPPLVVSSVRDILQERKKPGRDEETASLIENAFDHVIVHSDPEVINLDETFPLVHRIANKLSYSGFVVEQSDHEGPVTPYDVIVTAGGGAFGGALMQIALEAAASLPDQHWCLATGPALPTKAADILRKSAPKNATIVPRLENLAAHLMQARVSVSQCGYNTAMDALKAHRESDCRAVFVPYDTEGQSEQLRRAELLQKAGYAISLPQSRLTAGGLVDAVAKTKNLPKVQHAIDFDGVGNSARLMLSWLNDR